MTRRSVSKGGVFSSWGSLITSAGRRKVLANCWPDLQHCSTSQVSRPFSSDHWCQAKKGFPHPQSLVPRQPQPGILLLAEVERDWGRHGKGGRAIFTPCGTQRSLGAWCCLHLEMSGGDQMVEGTGRTCGLRSANARAHRQVPPPFHPRTYTEAVHSPSSNHPHPRTHTHT